MDSQTKLDQQLAAQLCNCTIEDIDQIAHRTDGTLVVIFIWGGKRTFTPEQQAAVKPLDSNEADVIEIRTTTQKPGRKMVK